MKTCNVPPRAGVLIEAMRDIGYSLEAAVADIIDNSITAGARNISIRAGWKDGAPWLAVVDDGTGMTRDRLIEAMRPGSRSPMESRASEDLGRFGLGLKTASFSQCRQLTVISRCEDRTHAMCWDLDRVRDADEWCLLELDAEEMDACPIIQELGEKGTAVFWNGLDRLDIEGHSRPAQDLLNERLDAVRRHVALVFHRFLSPDPGRTKIIISMNRTPITAFDPFNSRSLATQHLDEEELEIDGQTVRIQPYILPHHSKVDASEYDHHAGEEGYLRNQGFYIYRNRRLIIHGTWFRMRRQEELTKLARVRVDIPNTLDHLWTIDVRKSRANPPEAVRQLLRRVLDRILDAAKRPYTHRGTVIASRSSMPVWQRRAQHGCISYEINREHPLIGQFRADLDSGQRRTLDAIIDMISSSFPSAMYYNDAAASASQLAAPELEGGQLERLAGMLFGALRESGLSNDQIRQEMVRVEPFASARDFVEDYFNRQLVRH